MIQDFNALPPRGFMEQILDNTCSMYVFLWDRKDDDNLITMSWDDVSKYHHKNAFRSSLRKLNNKGLLQYTENKDKVSIELVGWDEI